MRCERLHFGLKLTRGVGILQFTSLLVVRVLHFADGSYSLRGNGLPDLSLQEEFGETSKHETKKSPKLYNLKLCGRVKITLVPLCSSN